MTSQSQACAVSELEELRRQVRGMRRVQAVLLIGSIVLATAAMLPPAQPAVIRTRGVIIEDELGRDRILIGAPIPQSASRIRTDTARARRAWGARLGGDRYMGYYAGYRHSMHGMLVLDEHGFDRLAIGDSTPDPNIGRRIGPATGIQINDPEGFERSGYGMLTVQGRHRVVLGLDGSDGREGVVLALFDGGSRGLWSYGPRGEFLFVGKSAGGSDEADGGQPSLGWVLRSADSSRNQVTIPVPAPPTN